MQEALQVYRRFFRPSKQLERPYAMLGANVVVAATDAEGRRHFSSVQQSFTNLRRGTPGQLPPPIDDIDAYWSPVEKAYCNHALACSFIGSNETVARGLQFFIDAHEPDELILTAHIHSHAGRLRSFELLSQLRHTLTSPSREAASAVAAPHL
jgi:alkanesulfonate monooxygenase SsuD/methylene tetrahydromethanopterin reductase-like flavin-dependent oxidoreductase (luciferase family)